MNKEDKVTVNPVETDSAEVEQLRNQNTELMAQLKVYEANYGRLLKAFNKALDFIGHNYAQQVAKELLDAVDAEKAEEVKKDSK